MQNLYSMVQLRPFFVENKSAAQYKLLFASLAEGLLLQYMLITKCLKNENTLLMPHN